MKTTARARTKAAGGKRDPLVTQAHAREIRWRREYAALRRLCLGAGLEESLKWGHACYAWQGGNVALIHGFKAYCALLFMKGALLKDPAGLLVQQTRNVQSARQLRFSSLADIAGREAAIAACLRDAIAVEKSGARVRMKTAAEFAVPEELGIRLDADPKLAAAFRALTPGRQKGYLLYFAAAKRAQTRAARVAKHAPRILDGLGLNV